MNAEKLAKLQEQVRIGGKGTPRRKMKKVSKTAAVATENSKMTGAMKRLNTQPIPAIDEVNMFRKDGQVLHFARPKVQAAIGANTFIINGGCEEKGKLLACIAIDTLISPLLRLPV